jgi:hypothetical protein
VPAQTSRHIKPSPGRDKKSIRFLRIRDTKIINERSASAEHAYILVWVELVLPQSNILADPTGNYFAIGLWLDKSLRALTFLD